MNTNLQETSLRILQKADQLFRKYGIRSVTMDDIAKALHMSKKTIYLHFSNKADIVMGVTTEHIKSEARDFDEIQGKSENAVEEMIRLMKWVSESFKDLNSSLIYDLKKYYPKSWEQFQEFKNTFIRQTILDNLDRGMDSGLYRPEMDKKIMAKLRLDEVEFFLDPTGFEDEDYDIGYVHFQLLEHYVHGLVTMKGKKLLNQYLKKDTNS